MPSAPTARRAPRRRATLRRSVHLFREFRIEQVDPERFYTTLAADTVAQLSDHVNLAGRTVLDVGGGPGFFRDAFVGAGARYVSVEYDVGELSGFGGVAGSSVLGDGMRLPLRDGSVGVAFSSNVLEHVADPWLMAQEMLRVTESGGTVYLSYGPWWGPWGGHETSPWHYLGGHRARRRYRRVHGREPKNRFGESLFVTTVRDGLRWGAARTDADLVASLPRYNPWWSWWLLRVPVVRELVTWNLVLVLRKH